MRNALPLLLCLVAVSALACAERVRPPPKAPERVTEHRPEDKPKKKVRPVVAPPPAYGNKVVLETSFSAVGEPEAAPSVGDGGAAAQPEQG